MIPFAYVFSSILLLDRWPNGILRCLDIPLDISTLLQWHFLHIFSFLSVMKLELNSLPHCVNLPLLTYMIIFMSGGCSDG